MQNVLIKIDGMSCDNCVKHVKNALAEVEGVDVLNVIIGSAMIVTKGDVPEEKLREALDEAGYSVQTIDKA